MQSMIYNHTQFNIYVIIIAVNIILTQSNKELTRPAELFQVMDVRGQL